jgi:hypothetical protein
VQIAPGYSESLGSALGALAICFLRVVQTTSESTANLLMREAPPTASAVLPDQRTTVTVAAECVTTRKDTDPSVDRS